MTQPACQHKRTQLIAKDNDAQYVECLDCGEILEAGEIEKKEGRPSMDRSPTHDPWQLGVPLSARAQALARPESCASVYVSSELPSAPQRFPVV